MPTGTPYNSCIPPYRIRVDDFAALTFSDSENSPLLHLLTHSHSDHINGLSAKSFGFKVYCSQDAKEMLLRHEVYAERKLQALELRAERIRTYSHLKVDPLMHTDGKWYYNGSRDLLHPLPLNTPTRIDLNGSESVTITLLDANHCPGAVMFLIEGDRGSVLHTGDFRAEPWFLESIVRNSFLQPYLSSFQSFTLNSNKSIPNAFNKTLEAIYLDTACVMSPLNIPTKESATSGLVGLMMLFPQSVYFFINSWTWGYEDILKAVARAFQSHIHVDRYKYSVYQHLSDPFLSLITTQDPSSTRFHACERFQRCTFVHVENDSTYSNATSAMGKRVIYINPVTMDISTWSAYLEEMRPRLLAGEEINNLLVPLSRHSTLPELQSFVKLFRPKRVVPNTLDPRLMHLDWACIDRMFASCLHPSARATTFSAAFFRSRLGISSTNQLPADVQNDRDVALKNLVGAGADVVAERWADQGKLLKKLSTARGYLGEEENAIIDTLLGINKAHKPLTTYGEPSSDPLEIRSNKGKEKETISRYYDKDSEDESDDALSEDERGKTAHKLFASLAGIDEKENSWWVSSPLSVEEIEEEVGSNMLDEVSLTKERGKPAGSGAWRVNRLTPVSSPVWPRRRTPTSRPLLSTPSQTRIQSAKSASNDFASLISRGSTRSPAKARNPSSGLSLSLASPICLLSSTSPDMQKDSKVYARSGEGASTMKHSTRDNAFTFPEPRALVFPTHLPKPSSSNVPQTEAKVTSASSNSSRLSMKPSPNGKHHIIAGASSPSSTSLSKRPRNSNEVATPTPHGKRSRPDVISPMPSTSKLPRFASRINDSTVNDSSSKSIPVATSDRVAQLPPYIPEAQSDSGDPIPVLFPMTESEKLQVARMNMAYQLAITYPDRVHPSYWKKRERQLKQLERKRRRREEAALAAAVEAHTDPLEKALGLSSTSRVPLIRTTTVPSFEPVNDGDGGMDWNRSRQLADGIREDLANGRQPSLPSLLCTRSQDSQSDQTQ
ncbi:hypothetical protein CPB84DRAFT_1788683 [Gymnopilus junonius]|uniref:Protein artemis n=1 Tax=Gymnopilus junonius TaxID=109634 RepID=A0A9P5NIB9_GYMJU|nr:hypothetical protein CPB84DRAFT_1788683 [Gymnopilus junonius]